MLSYEVDATAPILALAVLVLLMILSIQMITGNITSNNLSKLEGFVKAHEKDLNTTVTEILYDKGN